MIDWEEGKSIEARKLVEGSLIIIDDKPYKVNHIHMPKPKHYGL